MAMIENIQGVIHSYVQPTLNTAQTFVSGYYNSFRAKLMSQDENRNIFQKSLAFIEDAAGTHKAISKVALAGSLGFGAYLLKEKIPSIPAYLFVGIAAGYSLHENLNQIYEEIQHNYLERDPVRFAQSALITLAASYGTYKFLNKFSIVEAAEKALGTAAVTVTVLEILRRLGTVQTVSITVSDLFPENPVENFLNPGEST